MLASWEQEVAGEARAGHFEQEIINDSYLLEFEWIWLVIFTEQYLSFPGGLSLCLHQLSQL